MEAIQHLGLLIFLLIMLVKEIGKHNLRYEEVKVPLYVMKTCNPTDYERRSVRVFSLCLINQNFLSWSYLPFFIVFSLRHKTEHSLSWKHLSALADGLRFLSATLLKGIVYAAEAAVTRWMCSGRLANPKPTETACSRPPCPVSWLGFPGSPNPKGHQSQSLQTHKQEKLEKKYLDSSRAAKHQRLNNFWK